jgi:superfamily II DNA or RNA helicase
MTMIFTTNILLRDWQKDAFKSWVKKNGKGIISVVTGGGKTIFGLYCAVFLEQKKILNNILIIVPTKTLQDQWISTILSVTNIKENDINTSWSKKNKVNIIVNLSAQKIQFESYETQNSILILDECHRYGIESNCNILKANFSYKLGLTATLERKYDDGVENYLIPNLGGVIYEYGYKQALKDEVISNYELTNIRTFFNETENTKYKKLSKYISKTVSIIEQEKSKKNCDFEYLNFLKEGLKITLFKRSRLVNNTNQRIGVCVKLISDFHHQKKIVFCESINQAETIKQICKSIGISVNTYHSKQKKGERLASLISFQKNFSNTLIGCKSLDEGFDVPDIEVGIIVSQTKTSRQRIQRLGRTIRQHKGKVLAKVFTLYTTYEEKELLLDEMVRNPQIKFNWKESKNE